MDSLILSNEVPSHQPLKLLKLSEALYDFSKEQNLTPVNNLSMVYMVYLFATYQSVFRRATKPTFTCSKLTIETLEQRCQICSKLTIQPPKRRHRRRFGNVIVNFEHISHLCSTVSIVNFEHVIAGWVYSVTYALLSSISGQLHIKDDQ